MNQKKLNLLADAIRNLKDTNGFAKAVWSKIENETDPENMRNVFNSAYSMAYELWTVMTIAVDDNPEKLKASWREINSELASRTKRKGK